MARFGLIGGSYKSQSPVADAQMSMNWYPEVIESQNGRSAMALYGTPGLAVWCLLGAGAAGGVRGSITINSRSFFVYGTGLYEVMGNKTFIQRGTFLGNDALPASMAASSTQLLVAAAGGLYCLTLGTNVFAQVSSALGGAVSHIGFNDATFVALLTGANEFQISAQLDGTTWLNQNIAGIEVFPDVAVAMTVDHREVWFHSPTRTVPYYDSGGALFPYDVIPGGFIEQGIGAQASEAQLDNSLFWLGGDTRGQGIVWRLNGYTPTRISTHAVETAIQGYGQIADAIGYAYQDQGHSFYVLHFPTASATWVYDVATGLWHQRGYWNTTGAAAGTFTAHRSQCHTYNQAFGAHLVGDWNSGTVYEMNINYYSDDGTPIRRVRRSPQISSENQWLFHSQVEILLEAGVGPMPPLKDAQGNARDPQLMLRWSDDGFRTFSNEHLLNCGQAGEFQKRAIMRRLGRSRARGYEISATDPVPWRIIDGYVQADPGYTPSERISSQLQKVA